MPIARVQMPDGKIARFEVPEGTKPEAVEAMAAEQFYKPDAPGPMERLGRGFADVTEGARQMAGTTRDLLNKAPASIHQGLRTNPITGPALAVVERAIAPKDTAAYTKEKTEEGQLYDKGRGEDAGVDWMRLGGNLLGTAPLAAVGGGGTLAARAGIGAAQGAASSGVMFTPENESKITQTLVGAGFGAAVPVVLQGLKMAYSGAKNALAPFDPAKNQALRTALQEDVQKALEAKGVDWNQLTGDVRTRLVNEAAEALKTGAKLDPEAQARKAVIESVGGKPTRAAVTRSPQDWQLEQNMRGVREGVGDPLVARAQENAKAMTDYLGGVRQASGGKTGTAIETGESAVKALQAGDKAKEEAVGKLYDAFRATGAQDANVPAAKVADALGKVADEIGTENIPGAVRTRLGEFGLLEGKQTKALTVNEADKLNRLLNNNNPGHGPGSLAIGRIKSALNEALLDVPMEGKAGVDALKEARAAAAQRFAEQDASKGISAAVGDVAPDKFVQRFILGADARELAATKKELLKTADGQQAMRDVKGHVLDSLLLKATGATSVDDVSGRAFSGSRFGKALDAIEPEKLHMLFSPEEVGQLRALQKASKYLTEEVPFSDVNHSKTASALANLMLKIGNTPLLGNIASPVIGAYKLGADWMKDANARKAVAEALAGGSTVEKAPSFMTRLGEKRAPGMLEDLAPAGAGAAFATPGERKK